MSKHKKNKASKSKKADGVGRTSPGDAVTNPNNKMMMTRINEETEAFRETLMNVSSEEKLP